MGNDVCLIACKVRGVRDPSRRAAPVQDARRSYSAPPPQRLDDGTMNNFVAGFRIRSPLVPDALYGKYAGAVEPNAEPSTVTDRVADSSLANESSGSRIAPNVRPQYQDSNTPSSNSQTRPKIVISLKRGNGVDWTTVSQSKPSIQNPSTGVNTTSTPNLPPINSAQVPATINQAANLVAGNLGSFLSGIRATFRQDNVQVLDQTRPSKATGKIHNDDATRS